MAEQALSSGPAAVYHYENNQWKPVDGGISTVAVYHNPATGLYRVVAISPTAGAVINSAIFKELTLVKLSDNFYNWTDGTITYGVNFAQVDDASSFAQAIVNSIATLSGGVSAAPKSDATKPASKGVGLKPAAPSAAAASKPGGFQKAAPSTSGRTAPAAATPSPSPVAAKPTAAASPKPAAAATTTTPFPSSTPSKNPLPSPRGGPSAASSSSSSSSAYPSSSSSSSPSGQLTPEYEALKQELLSAFREELERARQDILDSLRR